MKRFHLIYVVAVLLLSGTASAGLTVYEYVPGEKVTLDTDTGYYWYWDVSDFIDMTYDKQICAIAALGNYGNIAGGWHMATYDEIKDLWVYGADVLIDSFNPTWIGIAGPGFEGRYDYSTSSGYHYGLSVEYTSMGIEKSGLLGYEIADTVGDDSDLGAYVVVSNPTVIPAPGALVLATIGLLSFLPCVKRLRRQH